MVSRETSAAKESLFTLKRREADAIDRNRITIVRVLGNCVRLDYDARLFTAPVDRAHASKFFNDAGEHVGNFRFLTLDF